MIIALLATPIRAVDLPYTDPNDAFSLQIAPDWKASAQDLGNNIRLTTLESPGDAPAARLFLLSLTAHQSLDPKSLHETADQLCKVATAALQQNATITSQKRSFTRFNGRDAIRVDLTTTDDHGIPFTGYLLVTLGKTHAVLITAMAPTSSPAELKKADATVASFALEPPPPRPDAQATTQSTNKPSSQPSTHPATRSATR